MNIFKKPRIQVQLERILAKYGELENFKLSEIFQTSLTSGVAKELHVVKFRNIVTCYFITEEFGNIDDSPSVTSTIGISGKWKYLASHRERNFSKELKSA